MCARGSRAITGGTSVGVMAHHVLPTSASQAFIAVGDQRSHNGANVSSYPETLGALKRSPHGVPDRALRSVKDELRQNLLARLCQSGPLFEGVIGYEDTVMPQIVNAILSRHNFILLGLRGQAKSRILRALATLLDDAIPIVAGSEINDNPFAPISKFARTVLTEAGDDTPIAWVGRDNRYVEK